MRRHPALRSLTSEHHTGLVISRRARKAAREDARGRSVAWEDVKNRFQAELEGHFRREEQGLLPVLRTAGEVALVQRTFSEHRALRTLISKDHPEYLAPFAELLAAHIRFEETELFETAQRVLGSKVLSDLEPVLTDGRRPMQEDPADPSEEVSY